jgi:hypothetical protein
LLQDVSVTRRFAEMDTWLEQRGLLSRRKFGLGELLFTPDAQKVHRRVGRRALSRSMVPGGSIRTPQVSASLSRVEISDHSLA